MRLFPVNGKGPLEDEASAAPYADFEIPFEPHGRPYTAVNMVASLDGKVAVSGKSGSIGSETDRAAMRNLREAADAVIVGAGSLRAEKMSLGVPEQMQAIRHSEGKLRQPLAVVIGGLGGLPLKENLIGFSSENTLVFLPEGAESRKLCQTMSPGSVELMPTSSGNSLDLRSVFEHLFQKRGVNFALVEGGPSLNRELFSRSLVDDLFITISPKLLGGPSPTIVEGDPLRTGNARLLSAHKASDELFLRYRLQRPPAAK